MTPMQVHAALDTLTLLVDTREQPTARFAQRMAAAGLPYTRKKLNFGDYSARCTLEDGRELDLSGSVAIERKMNLDELCQCYTRDRQRFEREFQRAQSKGAKLYLIVENGSWEKTMQQPHGPPRPAGQHDSLVGAVSLSSALLPARDHRGPAPGNPLPGGEGAAGREGI